MTLAAEDCGSNDVNHSGFVWTDGGMGWAGDARGVVDVKESGSCAVVRLKVPSKTKSILERGNLQGEFTEQLQAWEVEETAKLTNGGTLILLLAWHSTSVLPMSSYQPSPALPILNRPSSISSTCICTYVACLEAQRSAAARLTFSARSTNTRTYILTQVAHSHQPTN
ncbi:hypothetical protein GALMADRAFT_144477 [Galerina marginata CBS 339.88]|uniref:Uncharacterized protein n=1 Tax=Galerina marginata (strain CBS 339.88) TaxID=685588 RepID=A0A067SUY0_GALM3|nr:hypothetical protein GALMADRAFT_144477 [Galerina marginata CBS 339.88]